MIKRRISAWILAALLLAGCPVQTAALHDTAEITAITGEMSKTSAAETAAALPTEAVLPLLTEEAPDAPSRTDEETPAPDIQIHIEVTPPCYQASFGGIDYETDRQKLVPILRQAMVARQEQITLYYQTTDLNEVDEMIEWLVDQAMQETDTAWEGDYLHWQCGEWGCDISGSVMDDTYYLTLDFQVSYYTTAEQEQEVTRRVNEAISGFRFDSTTTDYEKVRTIYEYLLGRMTYDNDHLNDDSYKLQFTAYAALVNGTSVCQGYANLLYRMLRECGVPCRLITGTGISNVGIGNHAWNIICLDGMWYNVDLTWDDAYQDNGVAVRPFFLRGSIAFDADHIRDAAYTSAAFAAAYPTSAQDYVPTSCDRDGHIWGAWVEDRPATCTEEGHRYRDCENCTARQEESLPVIPAPAFTTDDLTILLRHVAMIEIIEDGETLKRCDFDHSGDVDAADVTILAQYLESNP